MAWPSTRRWGNSTYPGGGAAGVGRCRLMSRDANSAHEMNSLSFIRRPRQEPWRSFAIWVTDFQVRVSTLLFSLNHPLQGVQPHSNKQSLLYRTLSGKSSSRPVCFLGLVRLWELRLRRLGIRSQLWNSLSLWLDAGKDFSFRPSGLDNCSRCLAKQKSQLDLTSMTAWLRTRVRPEIAVFCPICQQNV